MSSTFTTADAFDAIVTEILDLWAASDFDDIVIYGVNGPAPNLDDLQKVVHYDIRFGESKQVTIAKNPVDRTWGSIEFHFGVRAGKGTRSALVMQAYVKDCLKALSLGRVKTLIPSAGPPAEAQGWVFQTLYVPFYFDSSPPAFKP